MATKHTPGKYFAHDGSISQAFHDPETGANLSNRAVGRCYDAKEAKRIAAIINSHNDMIEILDAIIDGSWWASVEQVDDASDFDQNLILKARKVIAKAKGGL